MKKTIVIGDIHGRSVWKLIVNMEKPDRVIFIGDYFDSFDIKGLDQLSNFQDIIAYKESGECEVIMLIGNHDHHYLPEIGDTGTSGYQNIFAPSIKYIIGENRKHLQMVYQMDEFLFSHAGISSEWLDDNIEEWDIDNMVDKVNELFHYQPNKFNFRSYKKYDNGKVTLSESHGSNTYQSPIWIRPKSLMRVNKNTLRKKFIQIVGHTEVNKLDLIGAQKAAGGRYYLIDCLGTSGEYLIIENGILKTNTWKN